MGNGCIIFGRNLTKGVVVYEEHVKVVLGASFGGGRCRDFADAALRTASNRLSGVTTRHISSTVRILLSNVVKADGHCGNQV